MKTEVIARTRHTAETPQDRGARHRGLSLQTPPDGSDHVNPTRAHVGAKGCVLYNVRRPWRRFTPVATDRGHIQSLANLTEHAVHQDAVDSFLARTTRHQPPTVGHMPMKSMDIGCGDTRGKNPRCLDPRPHAESSVLNTGGYGNHAGYDGRGRTWEETPRYTRRSDLVATMAQRRRSVWRGSHPQRTFRRTRVTRTARYTSGVKSSR